MSSNGRNTGRRDFLRGLAGASALGAIPTWLRAEADLGSARLAGLLADPRASGQRAGDPSASQEPYDLVLAGGHVVDPSQDIDGPASVGILRGRIAEVAETIPADRARRVIDVQGRYVTPGLIDIHVHVYDRVSFSIDPDVVGVAGGVTSVIDGGSSGALNFEAFKAYVARPAGTRVYAFLNIASSGMTVGNETADLGGLDPEAAAAVIEQNRDVIVGLKCRMLAGIPEGQDLEVMARTRRAAELAGGVPIMVHIGGQSSPLPRVLAFLRPGDVVTHAMRGRGSILDANGRVYPEVREAVANGIHLDIGHGRGNLDFDVAERILDQGVVPSMISSDVHRGNVLGPVFGLPLTLSKFMRMGMSLPEVIRCATATPANVFDLGEELGTLRPGAAADVSILEMVEDDYALEDSGGKTRTTPGRLVAYGTLRDGNT